jgi:hypothetical protein
MIPRRLVDGSRGRSSSSSFIFESGMTSWDSGSRGLDCLERLSRLRRQTSPGLPLRGPSKAAGWRERGDGMAESRAEKEWEVERESLRGAEGAAGDSSEGK